jgi:hypothetical protein
MVSERELASAPEGFDDRFEMLPVSIQQKVCSVMASQPHLSGEDLLLAVEDKLTLDEVAIAKEWASYLSDEDRNWLSR